ncbi:MAG: AAA family ATPase [Candidatus Dormibacteria bacterium]
MADVRVGTRKLDALLRQADEAQAKVVLVGDERQLPEIDAAPGCFAHR